MKGDIVYDLSPLFMHIIDTEWQIYLCWNA